jgi:glycosyl transferase, family 25
MPSFEFTAQNTFCISLEKRWPKMKRRLDLLDLSATRFPAAVANTSDIEDHFYDYLNGGQRGCAQSHIQLWRTIVNQNLPYALIVEDDACFDKNWRQKLEQYSLTIEDPEWDAVFLNVSEPMSPLHQWQLVQEQYLTGGYILSQKGAKKILALFEGYYGSSDWMTTRLQTLGHSYSYFPWLIIQEGDESTIGSGVEADHAKVLRCLGEIGYGLDNYVIE